MRASLTSSPRIHYKSIVFSRVQVKYLFCTPCCAPVKDVCLFIPLSVSLPLYVRVQTTDLEELVRVFRSRSPFLFPLNPPHPFIHPHSLFTISPISACSVVAVSLCVEEACMCILTWAALQFPPTPPTPLCQHRAPAACALDFFYK